MPLGHLYSDGDTAELLEAGREIGIAPGALQCSRGFFHFDLWGEPLKRAKARHRIVGNREIYRDMKKRG